jgi:hypothetical protein
MTLILGGKTICWGCLPTHKKDGKPNSSTPGVTPILAEILSTPFEVLDFQGKKENLKGKS